MVILLTGATGFIGSRIAQRLRAVGHTLILAVRDPTRLAQEEGGLTSPNTGPVVEQCVLADLATDRESEWNARLEGVDAVINAAGLFREQGVETFEAVHQAGPVALFRACTQSGVKRVIQISALGADSDAITPFLRSKKLADDVLLNLPLSALVLQPSLVFGTQGISSQLFLQMATWPLLPLPGGGQAWIQPVHVDDVAEAVIWAIGDPSITGRMAAVGPVALTLNEYLTTLRRGLGDGSARVLPLPSALVRLIARVPAVSGGWLDRDALSMLERGSCAPSEPFAQLVGRLLRSPAEFVIPQGRQAAALRAKLQWLLPMLRLSVAIVWLTAGIVSLGLYPVVDSLALLAAAGATGWFALLLLYGAAGVDILLGVGTLCLRRRRRLWQAQILVMLFYTAVITIVLPEFWLHPYGPVVKNLPLLMAILLLMKLEE